MSEAIVNLTILDPEPLIAEIEIHDQGLQGPPGELGNLEVTAPLSFDGTTLAITGRIGNSNLPLGAQIYDTAGTPKLSGDFSARAFYRRDGVSPIIEWDADGADHTIRLFGGDIVIGANNSTIFEMNNWQLWVDQIWRDGTTGLVIDLANRTLTANDGSTTVLDFHNASVVTLGTNVALAFAGTGAANTRSNLGLVIGTNVQAWDADLTTLGAGGSGARSFLGLGTLATQNGTFSDTASLSVDNTYNGNQTFNGDIVINSGLTLSGTADANALLYTASDISVGSIVPAASQSIRRNSANTAFEAFTPIGASDIGTVTDTILASSVKPAITVVAIANLTLSGEQTIDGQLTSGSIVLATAQSTGSQNGPWITAAGAWTRPGWYTNGSLTQAPRFLTTFVRLGTTYQGSIWRMTTASVTIGTTATTWVQTPTNVNSATGTLAITNGGTGITSFGTGVATALAINVGSAGALVTNGGALGTPSGGTLTNATGLPISTGVSGLAAGAATFLATPTAANLKTLLTDETTVGYNFFTLANPSAITFPRINADNTVSTLDATTFRAAIGAGSGGGDALVANPLSQFASTTSAQLRGVLSDELGTGAALFDGATPTSLVGTNISSLNASNLTSGTVPTARLGSGTANSGNFLRGDQTWTAVTVPTIASTSAVLKGDGAGNAIAATQNGTGNVVLATSPSITTPAITTGLNDVNGLSMIAFTATASAVDGFTFTNSATAGHAVTIAATGSDTNIDIILNGKGNGGVTLQSGGTTYISASGNSGMRFNVAATAMVDSNNSVFNITTGGFAVAANAAFVSSQTNNAPYDTKDTSLSRVAAGVWGAGTGAAGSVAGSIRATFVSAGTATTCTGATIGTGSKSNAGFVTATTTGTSTIVITFPFTAPTGWNVSASDSTAVTNMVQTASSTTTATLSGTTVTGDVIRYIAMAY